MPSEEIRAVLKESPFLGEGHKKVTLRLRQLDGRGAVPEPFGLAEFLRTEVVGWSGSAALWVRGLVVAGWRAWSFIHWRYSGVEVCISTRISSPAAESAA